MFAIPIALLSELTYSFAGLIDFGLRLNLFAGSISGVTRGGPDWQIVGGQLGTGTRRRANTCGSPLDSIKESRFREGFCRWLRIVGHRSRYGG